MKNLTPKNKNIIITSLVACVAVVLTTICSIGYVKHTNMEVDYVIREGLIETSHLSDYSPSIKGSEGDATIYKNFGSMNSVLVSKNVYTSVEEISKANLAIDEERFAYEPFEEGKAMLFSVASLPRLNTTDGANAIGSSYDGFICSYKNAQQIANANKDLKISNVEIELFPKMLVLGGTHPYEASGFLTATMLLENVETERGVFFVINEANKAGFNYEQAYEARQETFKIPLVDANGNTTGYRTFKTGSRYAHLTQQWPSPDIYVHPTGRQFTAAESRNLNRVYPGDPDGNFTERVAYGIVQCILQNNITMVVDLHEASPEYYPNNAIIYHQDTGSLIKEMRKNGLRNAEGQRLISNTDLSATGAHGLSHREIGDYTNAYVMLCESNDVNEGRIHGALTADLITYYDHNDKFYEYLSENDPLQYCEFWSELVPIDVRVGRHTLAVYSMINAFNETGCMQRSEYTESFLDESLRHQADGQNYTGRFIVNEIPSYEDLVNNSLGAYLLEVK